MKFVTNMLVALAVLVGLAAEDSFGQQARITGTVTDAVTGEPLIGANIGLQGTNIGSITDIDGQYGIDVRTPRDYVMEVRFVGYQTQEFPITVVLGETIVQDVSLVPGIELDEIVVTTPGGAPVKKTDFPMPVEIYGAEELMSDVTTNSSGILRKKPGVDMQCTGIDRCETVLRGFNNAFSSATYLLTDYRQAAVPSLGVNIFSITPAQTLDVDRIQVVRGPASALYGAGVDAGVIHFFTKDAFRQPGTTIAVSGGERSFFSVEGRHAGRISDRVAYKITGIYGQADDWELDVSERADSIFARQECEGATDPQACFDAGGARTNDYRKINVNGTLQFKVGDSGEIVATGGYAGLDATVLSGIGTVQADNFGYTYGQLRYQTRSVNDAFFVQAYLNRNNAGDSFVYGSGINVVDKSIVYNLQAQYDRTFGRRHSLVGGVDLEFTRPDTEGRINGRNEDKDNTEEYGAYVQGQLEAHQRLVLTGALRGDYDSVSEEFRISPRAAATAHVGPGGREQEQTFRTSFNIAFSSPGVNSNFLDIVAGQIPGTDILVRGKGSAEGHSFRRNAQYGTFAPTDLVASSLLPTSLGQETPQGVFLQEIYGLVHAGLAAQDPNLVARQIEVALGLPTGALTAQTVQFLVGQLSPANTSVTGFAGGLLGVLNPTTGEISVVNEVQDIDPLKKTTTTTLELGYTGAFNFGDRGQGLVINIDGYYANKKDFVGPLLMETPFVLLPPNFETQLTTALATGIGANPVLTGALAQLGVSPAQAAALVVGFASDDLPSAVAIVETADNAVGAGNTPELMLSYRNFGDIKYWGVDASFELTASKALTFFGNVSFVDDDYFDEDEVGDEGLSVALNATKFKGRLGGQYNAPGGFYFNVAGRYTDEIPIQSGPYVGINCRLSLPDTENDCLESYFLLDVGAGYVFRNQLNGLRLDIAVNNVLDNSHREFIGAPKIGRMAIARLTYTIN